MQLGLHAISGKKKTKVIIWDTNDREACLITFKQRHLWEFPGGQRLELFFHCRKPCSTAKETKQKKKQWNFLIANEISLLAQICGGQIPHLMCEVTNIKDFFF